MRRNSNQNLPFALMSASSKPSHLSDNQGSIGQKGNRLDVQVWRKGMSEWKSPREGDFAELVAVESLTQQQSLWLPAGKAFSS
jgi:hypothetical protein